MLLAERVDLIRDRSDTICSIGDSSVFLPTVQVGKEEGCCGQKVCILEVRGVIKQRANTVVEKCSYSS